MRELAFHIAAALFITALGDPQPHPCGTPIHRDAAQSPAPISDSITTGPVAQPRAKQNREYVEARTGVSPLPDGKVWFDRAAALKPGVTLAGPTAFTQPFTFDPLPASCTAYAIGSGLGHVDRITFYRDQTGQPDYSRIICAAADKCPPGTLVYLWKATFVPPTQVRERRTVVARAGNVLVLDAVINPRCDSLKWMAAAAPIADVQEGSPAVVVTRGTWAPGQTVLVTEGPSIANEAVGEQRQIAAVNGLTVTLDRPVRRSYTLAALAKITPVESVTLRDLTLELPINPASEALFAGIARGWRFERCVIRKAMLGTCSEFQFVDCTLGDVYVVASCHDLAFRNCRIRSITFEEGSHDCTVTDCRIGPTPMNVNCVSIRARSERITIRGCEILGGGWQSSAILMDSPGRECAFENLRLSGRLPCYVTGDRMRLSAIAGDGDIIVQGGSKISAAQIRAARLVIAGGDGVGSDCGTVEPATAPGWRFWP